MILPCSMPNPGRLTGARVDCYVRTASPSKSRSASALILSRPAQASRSARWIARPPKAAFYHETSTRLLTQPNRSSASIDNLWMEPSVDMRLRDRTERRGLGASVLNRKCPGETLGMLFGEATVCCRTKKQKFSRVLDEPL